MWNMNSFRGENGYCLLPVNAAQANVCVIGATIAEIGARGVALAGCAVDQTFKIS